MTIQDILVKTGRWPKKKKWNRCIEFDDDRGSICLDDPDIVSKLAEMIGNRFKHEVIRVIPIAEPGDTFEFTYKINAHE